MQVVAGFAKMAAAGMGCTLISRAALQAMIDGKVVERRKDIIDGDEQLAWGFFDCIKVGRHHPVGGLLLLLPLDASCWAATCG